MESVTAAAIVEKLLIVVPIFNGKGDISNCSCNSREASHSGSNLLDRAMKAVEKRLHGIVTVN